MSRLPFKSSICGVNQIDNYGERQITHILSILDPGALGPLWPAGFDVLPRLDLRFHDATTDAPESVLFSLADIEAVLVFADSIATAAETPDVLVHCTHGMSRSTACTAIMFAHLRPAFTGIEIFTEIVRMRDIAWPNLHIVELADASLDRRGDLIAGAKAIYRYQLQRYPDWAERLTRVGRGREVAAAAEGACISL